MRKLKLESLTVQSFQTTAATPAARGTVQGNDALSQAGESVCICQFSNDFRCRTYDYEVCGDTNYLDCTLACTDFESCLGPGTC